MAKLKRAIQAKMASTKEEEDEVPLIYVKIKVERPLVGQEKLAALVHLPTIQSNHILVKALS